MLIMGTPHMEYVAYISSLSEVINYNNPISITFTDALVNSPKFSLDGNGQIVAGSGLQPGFYEIEYGAVAKGRDDLSLSDNTVSWTLNLNDNHITGSHSHSVHNL